MSARTCLMVVGSLLTFGVTPTALFAQFNVPLPQTASSSEVRREDIQILFVTYQHGKNLGDKKDSVRSQIDLANRTPALRNTWNQRVTSFCEDIYSGPPAICMAALQTDSLDKRLGRSGEHEPTLTKVHIAGFPTRPVLANYMQGSGISDAFTFASQFSANISEKEAYIVSNIIRGLTGKFIFSADYAVVVAKSEEESAARRDTIESDKANALRAINNGGTLVGRFTVPFLARSGTTGSHAFGLAGAGGLIGPIADSDETKRKGVLSGAIEGLGALAIRSLTGDSEQKAELIYGARFGHTHAFGPIVSASGRRTVTFGQAVIGLRQNGTITVSGLVTVANHGFDELVPKLVLNFVALH